MVARALVHDEEAVLRRYVEAGAVVFAEGVGGSVANWVRVGYSAHRR